MSPRAKEELIVYKKGWLESIDSLICRNSLPFLIGVGTSIYLLKTVKCNTSEIVFLSLISTTICKIVPECILPIGISFLGLSYLIRKP